MTLMVAVKISLIVYECGGFSATVCFDGKINDVDMADDGGGVGYATIAATSIVF